MDGYFDFWQNNNSRKQAIIRAILKLQGMATYKINEFKNSINFLLLSETIV